MIPDWVLREMDSADAILSESGYAHTGLRAARDYVAEMQSLVVTEGDVGRAYSAWANAKLIDPNDTRERLRVAIAAYARGRA